VKRLYLQIYLTVIASLIAFATAAGALWWIYVDQLAARHPLEVITEAAQALPAADAPQPLQQAAINRLAIRLKGDAALFAGDRTLIAQAGRPLPVPREGREFGPGGPRAWTVPLADGRWLVGRVSRDYFRARRPGPLLGLALVALAIGVGAYPVVRRVTRRLEKLKASVDAFGAGEFSARVTLEGRDEVAQLAASFNRAAAQIEGLLGAHKALLANASHELRTPLARIRMAVELMKESADPARRVELERDIAELDALIEEILLASRLDAMRESLSVEPVDLLGLAAEECARYEEAELDGERLSVRGDPRLLRRMIRNLLENARQHGVPPIEMRVRSVDGRAEIRVCDQGAGVPEPERERVFEPFHRRMGASAGAGLGLALVRQIARRHGGDAACSGNCFTATVAKGEGTAA
jgi:two-component system, OmpR family, sensor histidine kinase RstB